MVRAEASWGGWQGASETHVRSDLERASNAARRLKLLPARRVAPLFALSGVAPQSQTHQRVCSFVAPCSDQKSASNAGHSSISTVSWAELRLKKAATSCEVARRGEPFPTSEPHR